MVGTRSRAHAISHGARIYGGPGRGRERGGSEATTMQWSPLSARQTLSVLPSALPRRPMATGLAADHRSRTLAWPRSMSHEAVGSAAGRQVVVASVGGSSIRDPARYQAGTESSHKTVNWPRNAAVIANCGKCPWLSRKSNIVRILLRI